MRRATILLTLLGLVVAALPGGAVAAPSDVLPNFQAVWERTDSPQVRGDRPFVWGPRPILPTFDEPLAGVPGERRRVLYFDKARMEVNDPDAPQDQWYVTNGLLVVEMVTGRQQVGVNPTRYAERAPAEIPFGDLDDPTGPTFRSFGGRLGDPPLAAGQPVAQQIDRAGAVTPADAGGVTCGVVVAETRHCVADVFAAYLETAGPVYAGGRVQQGRLFDPPFYATGLPIAEPYWITVRAAGKPTRVLIQLFERRTLTYNPANDPAARVEMGNVGLQYYNWRYTAIMPGDPQTGLDPAMRGAIAAIADAGPKFQYLAQAVAGRFQLLFLDLS